MKTLERTRFVVCVRVCGFLFGQRLILSIQGAVNGIWSFENLCKSFNTLQTDHNDKPKAESRSGNDCFKYFTSKHFTPQGGSKLAQNVSLRFALVSVSLCVSVYNLGHSIDSVPGGTFN